MSDIKSELIYEKEERGRFFSAIPIYSKNKNSPDPKRRELSQYAANIVADGFIKYSGDKIGEITLDVIREDVLEHKELVNIILNKAEKAGVKVSLGENTRKYNIDKNNNIGINNSMFQGRN